MSDRERAKALLAQIPDYKIEIVLAYLQGIYDATVETTDSETTSDPFFSAQNMERLSRAVEDARNGRNMQEHDLIEVD